MKLTRFTGLSPLVFLLCFGSWHSHVMAEEKPLWEVGMGVMSVQLPAYRGSVDSSSEVLPIPYLVYRGEYVKADKDGLRGVLFDSDQFEVNLSLAASPPVSSSKVAARHDMPDLSSTLELGSSVDVKLWQSADSTTHLKLFVPMRAAFTVERQPRYVGWQFTPRINLDLENPLGLQGWTLGSVAGPVFGSREQHEYFYGVAPQYASAQRPAYDARGGYAGLQVLTAMWKRFPSYWVGGFVRYDNVGGAVFENSPLVTQRAGFSGGFAISWVFGQSSRMVQVER
jgi:outer membrane scaffolding protein for murein synthesis (MipA/OmpV family)